MDDKELLDLLCDCVKQDDKRNYSGYVKVSSNSKLKISNIEKTCLLFDENFERVKCVLDGAGIGKQEIIHIKGRVEEGELLTELSTSYDFYSGALIGFFSSILLIVFTYKSVEPTWIAGSLSVIVLAAVAFSQYRQSQTNNQKVRLQRLKNYLNIYLENMDRYQLKAAEKILNQSSAC